MDVCSRDPIDHGFTPPPWHRSVRSKAPLRPTAMQICKGDLVWSMPGARAMAPQPFPREQVPTLDRALRGRIRHTLRDDSAADDLAQQVWIEVFAHEHEFDPDRGSPWAFVSHHWTFIKLRYYSHRRRRVSMGTAGEESPDGLAASIDQPDRLGVSSADRRAALYSPETVLNRAQMFGAFLVAAMTCRRLPHERIASGFNALEWRPQEVAAHLMHEPMQTLLDRLVADYRTTVPWIDESHVFGDLRGQITRTVREVVRDKRTLDRMAAVADRTISETCLGDYCPDSDSADKEIHKWNAAVKKAALQSLVNTGIVRFDSDTST